MKIPKLLLGALALAVSLAFLTMSVNSWFYAGKSANILVTATSLDIEVRLFSLADFSLDGHPNNTSVNNFSPRITTPTTTLTTPPNNLTDPPSLPTNPTFTPNNLTELESNSSGWVLREIDITKPYVLDGMYPSTVYSFLLRVRSMNETHAGRVSISFMPSRAQAFDLAEVTTISAGGHKKLLFRDDYETGKAIELVDGVSPFLIAAGGEIEILLQITMESLAALRELNPARFAQTNNLNEFSNNSQPFPSLNIKYELTGVTNPASQQA